MDHLTPFYAHFARVAPLLQGGLSSSFLFNLFYEGMVEILNSMNCGICINNVSYNVFTCADDLLLSSTTVTGLQRLINCAVSYISNHGLRFNRIKLSV